MDHGPNHTMEMERMNKVFAVGVFLFFVFLSFLVGCKPFVPYVIPLPYGYRLVESPPGGQLRKSDEVIIEGTIIHFKLNTPWLVGDINSDNNGKKRRYFVINLQTGSIHFYSYPEPNERSELIKHLKGTGISLADQFYTLSDFKSGHRSLELLSH